MDASGAILCQLSALKDMLDQVNEEIEANFQITREIESEIVKCSEFERALAVRESELMKTAYMLQFEINGLMAMQDGSRRTSECLEKELACIKLKRDEIVGRINNKREAFSTLCLDFQKEINEDGNSKLGILLEEKEYLENEVLLLRSKISSLQNSMSEFIEEILEGVDAYNSERTGRKPDQTLKSSSSKPNQELCTNCNYQNEITEMFILDSSRITNRIYGILATTKLPFSPFCKDGVIMSLLVEIESGNAENDKLVKDINELKATLLAAMSP